MNEQYTYSTAVDWKGARRGELSAAGLPAFTVDAPLEFQGQSGAWTPEHLFVGALNSCFMTTFLAIAENSKLNFVNLTCTAEGRLEKPEGGGFLITEIRLRPKLTIKESRDTDRASRILEKAEKHCLISNSIKSTVYLEPEIDVVALAA